MKDDVPNLKDFDQRLRDEAGDFTSATWIAPDGSAQPIPDGALTLTPQTTTPFPRTFRLIRKPKIARRSAGNGGGTIGYFVPRRSQASAGASACNPS